jgi:hypothetical protein
MDRVAVLDEAGVTYTPLPEHLRGPGPHVRGCFALDAILGKSWRIPQRQIWIFGTAPFKDLTPTSVTLVFATFNIRILLNSLQRLNLASVTLR